MYRYADIKQHPERRKNVAKGTGLESFRLELYEERTRETEKERERERSPPVS